MPEHKHVVVSKRLVVINSASSLLAKIVNVTVILWMYQYLLTRISAEEFAVLPVVTSLMVFAPLFFSFFTSGISRYVTEAYAQGNFTQVTAIISSIFPLLAAVAVVFVTLGTLFAFNIEKVLNIAPHMIASARTMMLLLVLNFTIQMLAFPFLSGFHVRQRFVELNLLGITRDLVRIGLLLVFLLGIGPQVIWVVVATTIAETLYSAGTVWRARRMLPGLRIDRAAFSWPLARTLTNFGLWTTIGRLGSVMYTNAATILLNLYGTAVDVTSYHIGATMYRQIETTVALAAQPLQPTLVAMHALEDRRRLANTMRRGGRYAMWVTLAVAGPLLIFADEFIRLYLGDDYSKATMVLVLFMVIFPFNAATALLPTMAMATGQVKEFFLPAFLFQLAGLGLMGLSLGFTELGAIGVTASLTIITVGSQLSYYWRFCARIVGQDLQWLVRCILRPGLAPMLGSAAAAVTIKICFSLESWPALIVAVASAELAYLVVLLIFAIDPDERAVLGHMIAKIKGQYPWNSAT